MITATPHRDPKQTITYALNSCIETCTDGEKGYAAAAADARDPALKALFQGYALQRADFVLSLQAAVRNLGAFPENEGTSRGAAHRGWIGVRRLIEGRSDGVIVEECLRGERGALKLYAAAAAAVRQHALPEALWSMLESQRAAIEAAMEEVSRTHARSTPPRSA